ncbi:g4746 [Coccomyxa elongata]
MSGLVNKVKDTLNIGKCSDPEHHHPGAGDMVRGTNTSTKTTANTTTNTTGTGRKDCHENFKSEGKHVPWEDAQAKTGDAAKAAHDAEVYACKAHKHLSSVGESQQQAETARARLAELERELEGMRTRGVDLSAKQQEIEVARRAAKDADLRYQEAHKGCEHAERDAMTKEREAMEAQRGLDNERRSVQSIEEELAKLQKSKADAQSRYEHHHGLLRDLDNQGVDESEIERLNKELEGHANAVQEAEAALAAARERHNKAHSHLGHLRAEWEKHQERRRGIETHYNSTLEHLEAIKRRENELSELLATRRGKLGQHEDAARAAMQDAEAERTRAQDARRQIEPLAQEAQNKRGMISEAEREAQEAEAARRRDEQRQRELRGAVESQQRTVDSAVTDTQQRVGAYEKYKTEAQKANAAKEELWDEAMHKGGIGDRNADSKIAKMEERLKGMNITGADKASTHTTHRETTVVKEE